MNADDTIAAIATAPGRGAVGIVRVSGPGVRTIAHHIIGELPTPRTAAYRTVRNLSSDTIDHAIAIYYPAPRSFTGEDVLEIHTHGGRVVTREVLHCIVDSGARVALPGEFSKRAFLNGKIDLLQAEAIADLIDSNSTRAARLAQQSLSGAFSQRIIDIDGDLKYVRVHIEANIDFPEDDIPSETIRALVSRTASVRKKLTHLLSDAQNGARLNRGIDVAIVGKPNVGKSTLLNQLAREDRAIVDPRPGTTRDVLSVDIEFAGLVVRIHDTAGIRESDDPIEREGVRRARERIGAADALFHVYTDDDDDTVTHGVDDAVPVFNIRNKIDLLGLPASLTTQGNVSQVDLSARSGEGVDLLERAVLERFHLDGDHDSIVLARDRHLTALKAACSALDFDAVRLFSEAPELAAEQLRVAGYELGRLLGEFTSEDLLGEIFSSFCIGK